MDIDLWNTIDSFLRKKDIDGAALHLENLMKNESSDRFITLTELHFTNSPEELVESFNSFISFCDSKFDVQSVYLEMNGFDINYDLWFFVFFGYDIYNDDVSDLDWLSNWSSPDNAWVVLTGLESIQDDFRWYSEIEGQERKPYEYIKELAVLLVMIRFVQLIESVINSGKLIKTVPVLATAHDFDMLGRFMPKL
jgi:hypothetical protein